MTRNLSTEAKVTPTGLQQEIGMGPALAARIKTVTNHAALEAIVPTSGAPTFYCTGHTTAGDGGEGLWRWVAGNSDTANGGTILGSDAAGRWKRAYSGPVNVKWFGNNVSALVTFASDRSSSGLSTRLYFPSGTHDCTGIVFGDRMIVEGDGFESNLTNTPTFTITDGSGYKYRGRCSNVRFANGITLSNCVGVLFDNVHFSGPVVFHPTSLSYYNTFLSCVWNLADTAINCQGLNNFNSVINCKITPQPGNTYGIKIQTGTGSGPANGWNITNLSYEQGTAGTYGPAIDIAGTDHVILGGYFECPTYDGTTKTIYIRGNYNTLISPRVVSATNSGIAFSTATVRYETKMLGVQSPQKATSHLSVWNATTGVDGKYTIAHGLMDIPRTILITSRTPGVTINIDTFDATNLTVIAYNISDGSLFASETTLKAEIMLSVTNQF